MTKAKNDYQYTLEKRIVDLEAEDRRLNFIIENYKQQFSLQGVSKSFTLEDVKRAVDHWGMTDVPKEEISKLLNVC
tara:strand:- start:2460 stop:2687 length:228 start_codon:yes stop_codon:yes gene_type:complete